MMGYAGEVRIELRSKEVLARIENRIKLVREGERENPPSGVRMYVVDALPV